jgi:hypothetical protein
MYPEIEVSVEVISSDDIDPFATPPSVPEEPAPEVPEAPEVSMAPEVPEASEASMAAEVPGASEAPKTPDASDAGGTATEGDGVVPLARREEEDEPRSSAVPCVVASKEDLSWFQLEETSYVVLAMIDGESTVESIVNMLAIPRASALAILRELRSHGVIEFREPE